MGISPIQGAAYAAISRIVFECAFKINSAISAKFIDIFSHKFYRSSDRNKVQRNWGNFTLAPVAVSCFYLGYMAGNQVLSLLGRQIPFGTGLKISLASGVIGFFSSALIGKGFR